MDITTKSTRRLTICRSFRVRNSYEPLPTLNLTGKWLQQQGFQCGQVVDIECENEKLVITLSKEQRFPQFNKRPLPEK